MPRRTILNLMAVLCTAILALCLILALSFSLLRLL